MTTDQLRARIQAACDAAVAKGWRIVEGDWIRRGATNCCCPLGAVVLDCDPDADADQWNDEDAVFDRAAAELRVTAQWLNGFTAGFDGAGITNWLGDEACDLGREFREKYKEA